MTSHRRRFAALAVALMLPVVTAACGGDDSGPDTDGSGTPSATTADGTSTAGGSTASGAPQSPTFDLAVEAPVSIVYGAGEGDLPSDQPALAAGDLDGDGMNDLVIGARFADPAAGADAGAVYIVFGEAELPAAVDLGTGQQGLTVAGAQAGENFGFSTHIADLNGDGTDDLAVGAPFAQAAGGQTGAVYVFFGPLAKDGSEITTSSANIVISGETSTGFFGDSLAAGDVNADGTQDLIIGATFDRPSSQATSGVSGGAVYVFSGRGDWPASLTSRDAEASAFGEDDLDELGDFVISADVNGDGSDDIIATAEAADGPANERLTSAQVYVLFGGTNFGGTYDLGSGDADVVIYGARENDTLGFSLSAGDLNSDGTDDLAMGARLADAGNVARAGVVYVLFGGDLPAELDMASPPDSVRAIHGAASGDLLGASVYIGDVNGDGRNELLAGARQSSPLGRGIAGGLYVVEEMPEELTGVASAATTTIVGGSEGESLGGNALAADLDGDGVPELVVVAENATGQDTALRVGRVYVIDIP